ncbi:MAG: hypothetical protein BGN88_05420 [Clostridiales bacterium 43-6]|nr:MAG: hypothetical protein BGN88_05420 [Clostridiales bacterium 43-6]
MAEIEDGFDLTGTWQGDDGSVTYLRQVELGDSIQIFWHSTRASAVPYTNLFMGCRVGSSIFGQWVDLPEYSENSIGTMALEVIDANTIRQVTNTLRYGTKEWKQIRSGFPPASTPATEPPCDENKE